MRSIHATLILLAVVPSAVCAGAEVQPVDSRLLLVTGPLELHDKTITQVVNKLLPDIPVACEWLTTADATKRISVGLRADTSVAQALDTVVAQDPRYEWKLIDGWLHIMPRSRTRDYVMDKPFAGPLPVQGNMFEKVRAVFRDYPGQEMHATFFLSGPPVPPRSGPPVPTDLTIRQALDQVVWRIGGRGWYTVPAAGDRTALAVSL